MTKTDLPHPSQGPDHTFIFLYGNTFRLPFIPECRGGGAQERGSAAGRRERDKGEGEEQRRRIHQQRLRSKDGKRTKPGEEEMEGGRMGEAERRDQMRVNG